jgi:type 1 glutamine amidotransferase
MASMRHSSLRAARSRWMTSKRPTSCRSSTTTEKAIQVFRIVLELLLCQRLGVGADGFIGIHSATITFTKWPEYGEMIGGYFDEHPWGTFDAPILMEDPEFPGMSQWPHAFVLKDEIYQIKNYSRGDRRVLMRLDASKLNLNNPRVHRTDKDFAVAWAKMYGKGRV